MEDWLRYGAPESLSYYMFQSPKSAKRLFFDVVPKAADEYLQQLDAFNRNRAEGSNSANPLDNPVWHVHAGSPPDRGSPVSFGLMLNLVSAANAADKAILWGFLSRYIPGATPQSEPLLDRLAGYALTATFGPSLGTPLAALWTEYVGWQWAFWQIVAPCLLAMAAVAYGLPQDPLRLERFKQFNWRGLLLGFPAICMLVIGLLQGNRLDWFESPLIATLLIGGLVLLVLFMINEWSHPMPFFKLQMLGIRNLSFALIVLAGVLIVLLAVTIIPSSYLAQVPGYRPLQTAPVMLVMALPQLIALPLVAALCNLRWVDCRWVLGIGLSMLILSCLGGAQLTSAWIRDDFYALQLLQIFGQPMAVLPLLMLATGSITPQDGPFASAWFNTVKGLAAVVATGVLDALTTHRLHFHSTMLVDSLGNSPLVDSDAAGLAHRLHEQAVVLTSSDLYYVMAGVAAVLILLIFWMPTRIYPPRAPT